MTTIACSTLDGEMAADSLTATGHLVYAHNGDKIQRVELPNDTPALVACTGRTDDGYAFVDWLRSGKPYTESPELSEDFEALTLTTSGIFIYEDACIPVPTDKPFAAIGGGREIALGAMAAGTAPADAVEIACEWHLGSQLPVRTAQL